MAKLINILLQKSDPAYPWGFSMGTQPPTHPSLHITWVDKESIACQHLHPGDRVLEIEGIDSTILSDTEVKNLLTSPSKKLELLIMTKTPIKRSLPREVTEIEEERFKEQSETKTGFWTTPPQDLQGPIQNHKNRIESELARKEEISGVRKEKLLNQQEKVFNQGDETTKNHEESVQQQRKVNNEQGRTQEKKTSTFDYKSEIKTEVPGPKNIQDSKNIGSTQESTRTHKKMSSEKCSKTTWSGEGESKVITESMIFQNLNRYHEENRTLDPREEKRMFWEKCRTGDTARRFRWGDVVKPGSVHLKPNSKSEETLNQHSTSNESSRRCERSRSCEPYEATPKTNPFHSQGESSRSHSEEPLQTPPNQVNCRESVASTNPFLYITEHLDKIESIENKNQSYSFTKAKVEEYPGDSETFVKVIHENNKSYNQCNHKGEDKSKNSDRGATVSPAYKEDFSNKFKFFEDVSSPTLKCMNKNATEMIQDRLGPNSGRSTPVKHLPPRLPSPFLRRASSASPAENSLRKPSDFTTNQLRNRSGSLGRNNKFIPQPELNGCKTNANRGFNTFEKISRDTAKSPYENVETTYQKTYIEEETMKRSIDRNDSKTSAGFYDSFDEVYNNTKSNGVFEELQPQSFEQLRARLGHLLSGRSETYKSQSMRTEQSFKNEEKTEEKIEKAFEELAIKEGIMQDPTYEEYFDYIRQSSQISGGGQNGAQVGNGYEGSYAPPPPPPPAPAGNIPSVRLPSEIGPARKEPPAAIQNAMMTKDKKPFTYTPGGLDLNEIKSPRMARRINRNAHTEDSCTAPQNRPPPPSTAHQALPPSALAAMQPQIAIPVFPPGGMSSQPHSPSANVYSPPPPPPQPSSANAPPPPPPLPASGGPPPPPPLPSQGSAPPPPPLPNTTENGTSPKPGYRPPPDYLSEIPNHPPLRPVSQMRPNPVDFINDIPNHAPLKPVNAPPRSNYEPLPSQPIQVQLKPVSPKPSAPQPSEPQPTPIFNNTLRKTSPEPQPLQQNVPVSPPRTQESPVYTRQPSTPQSVASSGTPESSPQMNFPKPVAPSPSTLSRAPAPWMSSRPVQKETPPWATRDERSMSRDDESKMTSQPSTPQIPTYTPPPPVPPFNYQNSYPTPFSTQQQAYAQQPQQQVYAQQPQQQAYAQQPQQPIYAQQPQQQLFTQPPQQFNQGTGQPVTRVIPIQVEGREPSPQMRPPSFQPPMQIPPPVQMYPAYQTSPPMASSTPPPVAQAQHQPQQQGRTRIIPIQLEGADKTSPPRQQAHTPTQMRGSPRYVPSSPTPATPAESANGDTPDGRPKLQSQFSWSQGNPAPIQSRSFRVLQKITGSDDEQNAGPGSQQPPAPTYLVNRVFPPQDRPGESEF